MSALPDYHPDQRYIEGILFHEHAVLSEIYRLYAPKVIRWVTQNSGDTDDGHDVMQEAMMALYRSAKNPAFRLSCPFEAFLLLVAKRLWYNELKKRNRRGVTIDIDDGYDIGEDSFRAIEELLEREEDDRLVAEQLAKLGGRCREIIEASFDGGKQEKLAGILGVSYGYLRKKKSECMAKLIQMIRLVKSKKTQEDDGY
jgi:RNA polymerase sigma factor (sigma-70 family)